MVESSTVNKKLTVQTEGLRSVKRELVFYNLDLIIAVGYRVNSEVATRFRQWATARLNEFIIKGFTMDDWVDKLDEYLKFSSYEVLEHAGKVSHEEALEKADSEYLEYSSNRMKKFESDFDREVRNILSAKQKRKK